LFGGATFSAMLIPRYFDHMTIYNVVVDRNFLVC